MKVLLGGILRAFARVTVDDYAEQAHAFVHEQHPRLGRRYRDCGFLPMVELLGYLEANGFTTFIASGGDRDFMRPITEDIYGIPPERVIGSSSGLQYQEDERGGTLAYLEQMEILDDGPAKPVRIWSRIGRRPIVAGGNSNGDVPMLTWSGGSGRPALGYSSSTMTKNASSVTPRARKRRLIGQRHRAGRSSASRTTGTLCSPTPMSEPDSASVPTPLATNGLMWIPAQTYTMGSDQHYPEEAPAHRVSVDGFWIEAHQVTNAQFAGIRRRDRLCDRRRATTRPG